MDLNGRQIKNIIFCEYSKLFFDFLQNYPPRVGVNVNQLKEMGREEC